LSPRIALLVEYSGKDFHGSQYQVGMRTVQSELEHALSVYLREKVRVILSGRTDAGVHAKGLVVHFDLGACPDLNLLTRGLNGIMGRDISVSSAQVVDGEFHARFSALEREYVYRILNRQQRSALLKDTHYFVPQELDFQAMKAAIAVLTGTHDFQAFRSTNSDRTTSLCHVSRAELLNLGEGQLEFWICANHFVYNMVRIIVGTLVEIGLGKMQPESLAEALEKGDRDFAGPTAPAWGLTLNSVKYPVAYKLFNESFETKN